VGNGILCLAAHEKLSMKDLKFGECLGEGGFGAVYRGVLNPGPSSEEVAIKKLFVKTNGYVSPEQMAELEKEVAALRNLRHPRLVRFIGACLQSPDLCIVTEYMPNGSLHDLLHVKKRPLAFSQQLQLAIHMAEGVAYLHSLKPPVVHRDLKSLNIVLETGKAGGLEAKICDFGLTQSMDNTHISLKDGANGGSPRYMAPECYDSKGKITEKVDVWAMGCIFIEIFGGPLPYFECTNVHQIMAKVLVQREAPHVPGNHPPVIRPLVEQCLLFNIEERCKANNAYGFLRKVTNAHP
jgi:serine/threonine protein kinase